MGLIRSTNDAIAAIFASVHGNEACSHTDLDCHGCMVDACCDSSPPLALPCASSLLCLAVAMLGRHDTSCPLDPLTLQPLLFSCALLPMHTHASTKLPSGCLCRCLKSMIGESMDLPTQALALGYLSLSWGFGTILGIFCDHTP